MGGIMYKIALIDDEAVVRDGMKDLIPWEELGLELIGTAEDGEKGLLLIQEMLPDIVLLDINMPRLNGLDLAHILTKNYPLIKIILISGYDEFHYARQALRMGVQDYILKPVTKSEMVNLLCAMVGKLDEEREQIRKEADVLNKIEQSIPLIQQKLLEELVFTEIESSMIAKKCIKANIPYNKAFYGIFLIDADNQIENKELTYFAIQNIVSEMVVNKRWGILFELEECNAVLYFTDEKESPKDKYDEAIQYIKCAITELIGITVTIGVGTLVNQIEEISTSYQTAYYALLSRFFQGTNKIIENSKPYEVTKVHFAQWVRWESEVIKSIEQKEAFEQVINKIANEVRKRKMAVKDIEELWGNLACALFKKFMEIDPSITEIFSEGINLTEEIKNFKTLSDMQIWIKGVYERCMNYINDQAKPNKVHIKNILGFIEENYNMPDLSMKMVCDSVHISASHFSNIFKREVGVTFVQYLTEYRIEKAKRLLKYTPLRTYEISEAVGYADPHYFSSTFKKAVGQSPSEYRKISGERERK